MSDGVILRYLRDQHTIYNLNSDDVTLETPAASAYRKQDVEHLYRRLLAEGHILPLLNFSTGAEPEDLHVDLPPYFTETPAGFTSPICLKFLWNDIEISLVLTSIGFFASKGSQDLRGAPDARGTRDAGGLTPTNDSRRLANMRVWLDEERR